MGFGKDVFCDGIDIYNLADTGEIVSSITTCVGQSTASGPKVAIRRNRPFPPDGDGMRINLKSIHKRNETMPTMEEAIKEINKDAPHQQDQLNYSKDAARSLAASTHGAASHLTKTVCDEDEICVVRRLTTTETARLQGFPDDHTKIDGKDTSDAPQYKAHGNSWATPCAFFMSSRMEMEMRRLGILGTIRYATCCSGIEAHSVAVRTLDWKSLFYSEIEPFPCRVLAYHYPDTPNLGDMTQIHYDAEKGVITNSHKEGEEYSLPSCFKTAEIQEIPFKIGDLHVFSGGTPCQSISVAGKREGMAEGSGTRSSLAFHYQRIIDETRPLFTLWENVPGAFSSNGGADFIWFVNKCAESGYTMAWRVLDAQYTMTEEFPRAVPQRRRRIWLVGYRGDDWRIPARIVMELKKSLTEEPTIRIPGKGFKELNPDFNASEAEIRTSTTKRGKKDDGINMFAGCEDKKTDKTVLPRVSEMISFDEMPDEKDFAKVSQAALYEFIKKVGEPCFIGSVFRTDKKNAKKAKAEQVDLFAAFDAPKAEEKPADEKEESDEWEGAEKISPGILANIGNAGILANGRIATISCHEWTSGIQFSPKKYNAWLEVKKNWKYLVENDLLPKDLFPSAYDGTVCGLSDVLEENPDEKYNLSWRACYGILNRAMKRGKELPPALYIALVSTIRDNASLVKWYVLNGRDMRKKETDLTEREIAKACYDTFIAEAIPMDSIEAVEPKKGGEDEEEEDFEVLDDDADGEDVEEFCAKEGLPMADEENEVVEAGGNDGDKKISVPIKAKVPEMPNGVINVSGGETAATLLASGDAAVGTTQDANIIAVNRKVALGVDTKMDASRAEEEVSPTLLATSYKEPPAVVK